MRATAFVGRHEIRIKAMTAKQFLLSESRYCRRRAANCVDPFLAQELRRLADRFEQTADTAEAEKTPSDSGSEQISH